MINPCNQPLKWWGLYRRDYDLVTAESYSHPAKASWDLAFRILEHLEELGLLKPGAIVLDPMMGTGRFLLAACARGFKAIGLELEPKFVAMCQANKEYARQKLGQPLDWEIIQGDARNLSGLLAERGLVAVSSPPYADALNSDKHGIDTNKWTHISPHQQTSNPLNYGDTPGQIGNLPDKPLMVTSPPYGFNPLDLNASELDGPIGNRSREKEGRPAGDPLLAITSPPYEDSSMATGENGFRPPHDSTSFTAKGYGDVKGQIGQERGETYLSAMAQVYAEIARVADVLVVVVKNPTRNGKLRRLDLDTIALLETIGWRINCIHHAMLFEETEQGHLFDGSKKRVKGRMSFFKRLQWLKGKSEIADHEDVIIAIKA